MQKPQDSGLTVYSPGNGWTSCYKKKKRNVSESREDSDRVDLGRPGRSLLYNDDLNFPTFPTGYIYG